MSPLVPRVVPQNIPSPAWSLTQSPSLGSDHLNLVLGLFLSFLLEQCFGCVKILLSLMVWRAQRKKNRGNFWVNLKWCSAIVICLQLTIFEQMNFYFCYILLGYVFFTFWKFIIFSISFKGLMTLLQCCICHPLPHLCPLHPTPTFFFCLVLPFLVYSTKFSCILMIDVWADLFAQMDSDRPVWCADVQHHLSHINFGVKEILWVAGMPFPYILKCSLDSVLRYSSGISFVLKHHCSLRHINQRSYTLC